MDIQKIYSHYERGITSKVYDSKEEKKDTAFFCVIGENVESHQFIDDAVYRGASVVIGSDKVF